MIDAGTRLEERVLRRLYEGPASAIGCAAELFPFEHPKRHLGEVEPLLRELAQRAYLAVHLHENVPWYSLTPAGSERLAALVE
jgi:DNA-binding PadR family transcriptional regulator